MATIHYILNGITELIVPETECLDTIAEAVPIKEKAMATGSTYKQFGAFVRNVHIILKSGPKLPDYNIMQITWNGSTPD